MFTSGKSEAQFTTATQSDNVLSGVNPVSRSFGNDIYDNGTDLIAVSTWDDTGNSPSSFRTISNDSDNSACSIGNIKKYLIDRPIKINLLDITGRIVLSKSIYYISMLNDLMYHSDLKPSIYLLEASDLADNTSIAVSKFIVQ
ncbi:MAG TPA: hypothetical protein VFW78_02200 [Bacteroidia bacterium]|nr:hypothetical protein [Bacteroidia bacterium]